MFLLVCWQPPFQCTSDVMHVQIAKIKKHRLTLIYVLRTANTSFKKSRRWDGGAKLFKKNLVLGEKKYLVFFKNHASFLLSRTRGPSLGILGQQLTHTHGACPVTTLGLYGLPKNSLTGRAPVAVRQRHISRDSWGCPMVMRRGAKGAGRGKVKLNIHLYIS